MPRELVHWHIVDRVKFDPRLGPAAAAVLTRYTDQAMLEIGRASCRERV